MALKTKTPKKNIILFGPPGVGKGTQSESLVRKYGLKHISTGDIIRAEQHNETPLAAKLSNIPTGHLVPDEIVVGMVRNFIVSNPDAQGFLFDGFPRTVPQAIALDRMLAEIGQSITRLLFLEADDKKLIARLLKRGETSNREDDKDEATIAIRLHEYKEKTLPIFAYYANVNKVTKIDGEKTIADVTWDIDDIMANLVAHELVG